MVYKYPAVRLIIFTKAPQAGYCKTRLIPELGRQGAAALHQELIGICINRLCHQPLCPTELWCSPDIRHPYFQALAKNFPLTLYQQQGGDLGERMFHAMSCKASPYTIIIGTDCPLMTDSYVENAITLLSGGKDAVIGPAEDGGYVLLGLRHVTKSLFQDISWGTGRVLSTTTRKMAAAGLAWQAIDPLWDLDDEQDLRRYTALKIPPVKEFI